MQPSSYHLSPPARPLTPDRRHSATLSPRPLRSSPLAGPSLSRDGVVYPKSAPASRTPSLLSLDDASLRSSASTSRRVSFSVPPSHPSSPPPQELTAPSEFGVQLRRTDKRRSTPHHSLMHMPTLDDQSEKTSRVPSHSTRRASQISLQEGSDHWLTAAPYDTTPRFSRLGMAAPGVVMPVRKESMERTRSAASGSVSSLGSLAPSLSSSGSSRAQSIRRSSTPIPGFTPRAAEVEVYEAEDLEPGTQVVKRRAGTVRRLWRKLAVAVTASSRRRKRNQCNPER